MSSIPLPALSIRPPEQPDLLGQVGKAMSLKSMMQGQQLQQEQLTGAQQENQMRAQQIKDQQAMTAAMHEWDGKDFESLIPLASKNGASAQAVMGLKQKNLEIKDKYSQIAKNDAETGEKNLTTLKGKNDMVAGAVNSLLDAPDEELPQRLTATAQDLIQKGLINPQHAQIVQQMAQGDPAQIRKQLGIFKKSFQADSQQMEDALKAQQTREAGARANEADAHTLEAKSRAQWAAANGVPVGVPVADVQMADWLKKNPGKGPSDYEVAMKKVVPAYNFNLQTGGAGNNNPDAYITLTPSQKSIVDQIGQSKGDLTTALSPYRRFPGMAEKIQAAVYQKYPEYRQSDYGVQKKVDEAFTSGTYSQQLNAINTAREHMKTFKSLATALDNGDTQALNSLNNSWQTQFGSEAPTNFIIARDAFAGEVGKSLAGAGVTQGDRNKVEEAIKASESPKQLIGAADTADTLLAGKQNALKATYNRGKQSKPNFGEQGGSKEIHYKIVNGQLVQQ